MRILFFGTGDFGLPILGFLHGSGHHIVLVTNPPKPKGRGLKEEILPIHALAIELGVKVILENSIRTPEFESICAAESPELMVVVDYGKIIPANLIKIPSLKAINIHPSLLPAYRGATPIQSCLINGDTRTGVTIQTLATEVDAGDILLQESISVEKDDHYGTLAAKLKDLAVRMVGRLMEDPTRSGSQQEPSAVTHCSKISKEMLQVNWNKSAREINNLIRALHPPQPGARSIFRNKMIKFLKAEQGESPVQTSSSLVPGTILEVRKDILAITTGTTPLIIRELQPENKNAMDVSAFINGYRPQIGEKFGAPHA
jgi:methionyl-tRNA formyltransferase